MAERWHIIDDDGSREVIVDLDRGRICSGVKVAHDRDDWPAFTQLAIRAEIGQVRQAIASVAGEFDLPCRPTAPDQATPPHTIQLARSDGLTLVGEPGIDFEDRFITAASSEAVAEALGCEAVHFGHDPTAASLHLTRYTAQGPEFTWCDSLRPGPSFALTFHDDGRCTEQDPRQFALDRSGAAADRTCLNRRTFVEEELASFGLATIDPELRELSSTDAFCVEMETQQRPMFS
jgi:hypothetical protein